MCEPVLKSPLPEDHIPRKKGPIWGILFASKDLRSRTFTTVLRTTNMDYTSTNIIHFLCYFDNIIYLDKLNESIRLLDNHMGAFFRVEYGHRKILIG